MPSYCEISLPVPLDRAFTYLLPPSWERRAQPGCRVVVPFAGRKLTGVILALRDHPGSSTSPPLAVERLLDDEPVFDPALIELARWTAAYYCAPLGEVLRTMAPLSAQVRATRIYHLTPTGRDAARQLSLTATPEDATVRILHWLDEQPRSDSWLRGRLPQAAATLRSLRKQGLIAAEPAASLRDPVRSPVDRLEIQFRRRDAEGRRTKQRELLAYLELHPGWHRLADLEDRFRGWAAAGRALARAGLAELRLIPPVARAHTATPVLLNPYQQAAVEALETALRAKQFQVFLLQGVTGSGKTEVYLRAIDLALGEGASALLLVPEIALTPAVSAQFAGRFGDQVAVLHSALNDTERAAQWRRIQRGEVRVAVGTRSAVFAPLRQLGLLIVDEEHDSSYKQEETPRYHGRDLAVLRAQREQAVVVLGSATPSLESRYNVERGKYRLLELPERVGQRPLPDVELVDMRTEFLETRSNRLFSRRLVAAVQERLHSGEQVMLLMNRRGFSAFVTCRACGERIMCGNCSVTLTFHRRDRRLLCHYCGYAAPVPATCPHCGSEYLHFAGAGSERVEDELHQAFPGARIARLDRDTARGKQAHERILNSFRAGEFDILVGTQMIAKGHDIPNVTLAGIVNADLGLGLPDFRAAERTFQLITQAAGRAGRGQTPGQVLIQTINPDHYAIRYAAAQNYRLFYEKEIQFRRLLRYPPFAALASVVVRSEQQEDARTKAGELEGLLRPAPPQLKVLGPSEAPVARLKGEYRYQILLKAAERRLLGESLGRLRRHALDNKWRATALVIDVDPVSLL